LVRGSSHEKVIDGVREQLEEIFEKSNQSVYIYLDDVNKTCNKHFASLLGYASPSEWAAVRKNFPEVFIASKDRVKLVSAYQSAMNDLVGSTIAVNWKKKGGGEVPTTTILVPIIFDGHKMALHFISPS
jgi:carbohydrate-binding DOMON domain-containing protein